MKIMQTLPHNKFLISVFYFNPHRMMKEISKYTKVSPKDRISRLKKFNERLRVAENSKKIFKDWNVELDTELVKIPGRILPYAKLVFGNNREYVPKLCFISSKLL